MNTLKKYQFVILIVILEALSFSRYPNASNEMIFLVWAFVYLALFLQNFLNYNTIYPSEELSSHISKHSEIVSDFSTKLDTVSKRNKYIITEKGSSILLIIFFLANIILSISNS